MQDLVEGRRRNKGEIEPPGVLQSEQSGVWF